MMVRGASILSEKMVLNLRDARVTHKVLWTMPVPTLSLQGQVRALFRRGMRLLGKANRNMVVEAFREHKDIPRKNFARIEFLLNKGTRQLDVVESAVQVTDVRRRQR